MKKTKKVLFPGCICSKHIIAAMLATLIRDLRRRTHIFNTKRIPQRLRPGTLEHLAMIDAVAVGDKEQAQMLMAEHLENANKVVVAQLVSGRG